MCCLVIGEVLRDKSDFETFHEGELCVGPGFLTSLLAILEESKLFVSGKSTEMNNLLVLFASCRSFFGERFQVDEHDESTGIFLRHSTGSKKDNLIA